MKIIQPSDYRVMPWKNGLGTTTEIYRSDGQDAEIDWRVSIASVRSDGPFSAFPGYDRHILTIEGNGMVLEGSPLGEIVVAPPYNVAEFSGEWPVFARLRNGPVRDFNFIVRRAAFKSTLNCQHLLGHYEIAAEHSERLLHLLSGSALVNGETIHEGGSCILSSGENYIADITTGSARVAICSVYPRT